MFTPSREPNITFLGLLYVVFILTVLQKTNSYIGLASRNTNVYVTIISFKKPYCGMESFTPL